MKKFQTLILTIALSFVMLVCCEKDDAGNIDKNATITLNTPKSNEDSVRTDTIRFSWNTVSGLKGLKYDLYFDTIANPTTKIALNLEDTTFRYIAKGKVVNNKSYYWKVNIKYDGKSISESAVQKLTTIPGATIDPNTFLDTRDNKRYKFVKIGSQIWMAEDLNYTPSTFNGFSNYTKWDTSVVNSSETNKMYYVGYNSVYGTEYTRYSWAAAMNGANSSSKNPSEIQGICPTGWHLPSDNELQQLEIALGMTASDANATGYRGNDEAKKAKGTFGWLQDKNGTNDCGLNILALGTISDLGKLSNPQEGYALWTSTETTVTNSYRRYVRYDNDKIHKGNYNKKNGYAIRCVKDGGAMENVAPSKPVLKAPANNATAQDTLLTFTWNASSDLNGDSVFYDIFIGTTENPTTKIKSDSRTLSFSPKGLSFNTKYYWKVVAKDGKGLETASDIWNFSTKVNITIVAPTLKTPANGANNIDTAISLTWHSSPKYDANTTFDVYFDESINPTTKVATSIKDSTFKPKGLKLGTVYSWKVVAKDQFGTELSSSIWSFTTYSSIAKPMLFAPINALKSVDYSSIALKWHKETSYGAATTFDVYLSTNSNPTDKVSSGIQDSTYTASNLLPKTTYYWKVIAKDGHGSEISSDIWSFTTKAETITDSRDGKVYEVTNIGSQKWLAQNLAYEPKEADGYTGYQYWTKSTANSNIANKWYSKYGDADSNLTKYGYHYTFAAAVNGADSTTLSKNTVQGVCMSGWHVANDNDWKTMEMAIGMTQIQVDSNNAYRGKGIQAGTKIKSTSGWYKSGSTAIQGTDDYGLNIKPAGTRAATGVDGSEKDNGILWVATNGTNKTNAFRRYVRSIEVGIFRSNTVDTKLGMPIRCVKD